MCDEDVAAALVSGDARALAKVLRSAPELPPGSARRVLDYFVGRSTKGVAWMAGLDESEALLLLGHLRARAELS